MRTGKYIPQYTVSDYMLWDGQWELIDGIPSAMSPSPIYRHQSFLIILATQIRIDLNALSTSCDHCEVLAELDWIIADGTVLRPDIAIVCDHSGDFITKPPVLIVEILSPATAMKDSHTKFEIYQEQGVKYYIIANPATRSCQSYILTGQEYKETTLTTIEIHAGCSIAIDLDKAMAAVRD